MFGGGVAISILKNLILGLIINKKGGKSPALPYGMLIRQFFVTLILLT